MSQATHNSKVEQTAVLEAKRSIVRNTALTPADPDFDHGIDIVAFSGNPFYAYPIQVKGTSGSFKIWGQYAQLPMILVYVVDPLGETPEAFVMTGREAWDIPNVYVESGGKASDHREDNLNYRFPAITARLLTVLRDRYADSAENWERVLQKMDDEFEGTVALAS